MDLQGRNFIQLRDSTGDYSEGDYGTGTSTLYCGGRAVTRKWGILIWILIAVCLEFFLLPLVYAGDTNQSSIVVDSDFDQSPFLPHALLIADPEAKLTPDQALNMPGEAMRTERINLGITAGAIWLVSSIDTRGLNVPTTFYLAFDNPELGEIKVYVNGQLISETGQQQPFLTRGYLIPKLVVPILLTPKTSAEVASALSTILIRVESSGSMRSGVLLLSDRSLVAQRHSESLWQGGYYGLAFLVCCYFFGFFCFLRERIYLWVTGSLGTLVILQLNADGLLFQYLYPNNPEWFFSGLYLPTLFGYVASLLFVIEFFYLKERDKAIYRFFIGHIYYGGFLFIAWMFLDDRTLLILIAPFIFSGGATCVFICLKYLVLGNSSIVYYTMGMGLAAFGAVTYLCLYLGIVPATPVFETILRSTTLAEMALLSLSLFKRYQDTQGELRAAKDDMLSSLLRANKVKDEFLSVVSHELRTPMNGVEGALELVKGHDLPPQAIEFLEMASRSSKDMVAMINNILDYTELHEKVETKLEKFDLVRDVERLLAGMGERYLTDVVATEFSAEEGVAKIYEGDARLLFKVLRHVFSNAMKFTEQGKIHTQISVSSFDEASKSEWVSIRIKDTGTGIDSDHLEEIFDEFRQEDVSMVRKFQGLGLGLPISKGLMKVLRGSLDIESELGQGTEVILRFPLTVIQRVEQRAHERCNKKTGLDMLVVEDNLVNRKILVALLEKLGHTLSTAENGAVAVELAKQHQYDFIWMDCQMPVMDGIEATRHIRELAAYEKTPIVAVTANAFTQDEERCMAAGMSDFLAKPVNKHAIERVVSKWG